MTGSAINGLDAFFDSPRNACVSEFVRTSHQPSTQQRLVA
jgi:hypothetical protein